MKKVPNLVFLTAKLYKGLIKSVIYGIIRLMAENDDYVKTLSEALKLRADWLDRT